MLVCKFRHQWLSDDLVDKLQHTLCRKCFSAMWWWVAHFSVSANVWIQPNLNYNNGVTNDLERVRHTRAL